MEKKFLLLFLPYIEIIYSPAILKLPKLLKNFFIVTNYKTTFKYPTILYKKILYPKILYLVLFINSNVTFALRYKICGTQRSVNPQLKKGQANHW